MDEWPQNLMITAVNAQKQSESHSHPNLKWLYRAMASSGSLPGVWPATTVNGETF